MIGIYSIINLINGKIYIGQSINVENRIMHHKSNLKSGNHHNKHLQSSFNKYGIGNFVFNVLLKCPENLLDFWERYFINDCDSMNPKKGYNKDSGGNLNKHYSEESRKRMSDAQKGENHRLYGKHHQLQTRKKISDALKGENNGMCGKKQDLDFIIKRNIKNNTSGILRVYKKKDKCCNQGFLWDYQYKENNKVKTIHRVDLNKLESFVKSKGLEWVIVDEIKATQSYIENNSLNGVIK